ncbi:MAG: hypothetical protein WBD23_01670, partial [Candidatus Acidiferrales bacterium]
QGAYSMVGNDANGARKVSKLDEWRMYADKDGSYSVDIEAAAQSPMMEEHYVLTTDLKPKSFSLIVSSKNSNASGESVTISCDFDSEKITCHTVGGGVTASPTLVQKIPYVFMPTAEAPSLDLPWFFQTIASQAGRSIGQKSAIPLVAIEDGDTADSATLKIQEVELVEYLGREKIEVAGRTVLSHKFRISIPQSATPEDLWLSDSGLLLQLSQQGNPSLALTSYEGPPLINEH